MSRLESDLAAAQVARIAAEAGAAAARTEAESEAHALREQLLGALQQGRDAEMRAAQLGERVQKLEAQKQVGGMSTEGILFKDFGCAEEVKASHIRIVPGYPFPFSKRHCAQPLASAAPPHPSTKRQDLNAPSTQCVLLQ